MPYVAALFLAALLSACGELEPRSVAQENQLYNVENGVSPMHERTRAQNENRRMY